MKSPVFPVLVLTGLVLCVSAVCGQRRQISSALQAALNEYCKAHPNHQGCHSRPAKESVTGPGGCPVQTRRCPQKENVCLPKELPCDILDSRETCAHPTDPGIVTQTIFCGSGQIGDSCGRGGRVPVLSVIAVQCRHQGRQQPAVNSLQSFTLQGDTEGGAGIYRCLPGNQWEALYENSPFLSSLVESCYYAGCGRLPSPPGDRAHPQHWVWLRGIMDPTERVFCTATLVSSDSLVTAAHCVTESLTSTFPVGLDQIKVSVPFGNIAQVIQVSSIHIHPEYSTGDLRQNDIAVIKFNNIGGIFRPHACLPQTTVRNPTPPGVVFKYDSFFKNWTLGRALYSHTCSSSQGRSCDTVALRGQFCARQTRFELEPGSSGGPYLVNIVPGSLDYTWAVLGIYSQAHRASDSCNPNSVYVSTLEHIEWLQQCVLLNFCRSK